MTHGDEATRKELAGALPTEDPLREELGDDLDPATAAQWDAFAAEEADLRADLVDVDLPPDFETRLQAIATPQAPASSVWPLLVAAAAVILAIGLVAILGHEPAAPPSPAAQDESPAIVAVKFWHVTCPYCKELDPKYAMVVEECGDEPVLFVTFDMSTAESRSQSAYMASTLGIRELYDEKFGSSGFVVLFDAKTMKPVGQLKAKQDAGEMLQTIADAIAAANS